MQAPAALTPTLHPGSESDSSLGSAAPDRPHLLRLSPRQSRAWVRGTELLLPPQPFAVLLALAERPGDVLRHDEVACASDPQQPSTAYNSKRVYSIRQALRRMSRDEPDAMLILRAVEARRQVGFRLALARADVQVDER